MKQQLPLLLFLSFFLTSKSAFAKHSDWYEGYVVLYSGDTLRGELQFTRKVSEGLLQLKRGSKVDILTVKQVTHFSFYDKKMNAERKFYTLQFQPETGKRSHEIFTEYIYGNQKLWIINHRTMGFSSKAFQFNPFRKRTIVNQRYLVNKESGLILPMSKENALEMMGVEKKEVINYIQSHGVRLKTVNDFIELLAFQSTLF